MFVATINTPGHLPEDDDPPVFDTPAEAWAYLATERVREEDHAGETTSHLPDCQWDNTQDYSETASALLYIASGEHQHGSIHEDQPTNADGTGSVVSDTPGRCMCPDGNEAGEAIQSPHDLGQAYSVSVAEEGRGHATT